MNQVPYVTSRFKRYVQVIPEYYNGEVSCLKINCWNWTTFKALPKTILWDSTVYYLEHWDKTNHFAVYLTRNGVQLALVLE